MYIPLYLPNMGKEETKNIRVLAGDIGGTKNQSCNFRIEQR